MGADAHDIRRQRPDRGGRYFIDTNVLALVVRESMTGLKSRRPMNRLDDEYSQAYERFIIDGRRINARFFISPLSLSEFANYVERTYQRALEIPDQERKKRLREDPSRRAEVIEDIMLGWEHAEQLAAVVDLSIGPADLTRAKNLLEACPIDPYDAFIIGAMRKERIDYVISHDADFLAVDDVIVYTALPTARA